MTLSEPEIADTKLAWEDTLVAALAVLDKTNGVKAVKLLTAKTNAVANTVIRRPSARAGITRFMELPFIMRGAFPLAPAPSLTLVVNTNFSFVFFFTLAPFYTSGNVELFLKEWLLTEVKMAIPSSPAAPHQYHAIPKTFQPSLLVSSGAALTCRG